MELSTYQVDDLGRHNVDEIFVPDGKFRLDVQFQGVTTIVANAEVTSGTWIDGVTFGPGGLRPPPGHPYPRLFSTWVYFKPDSAEQWELIYISPLSARGTTQPLSFQHVVDGPGKLMVYRYATVILSNYVTITDEQTVSVYATPLEESEPVLRCVGSGGQENRVARGEELTCSVEADGSEVEIQSWRFTGTDSRGEAYIFPLEDEAVTDNPWRGKMAISGVVSVRARTGDGEFKELTAQITVLARDWAGAPVESDVRLAPSEEFVGAPGVREYPTQEEDLGATFFGGDYLSPTEPGVLEYIEDYGPNHRLAYLARVPAKLSVAVWLHPEMAVGSTFYRRQRASTRDVAYGAPCAQNRFEHYIRLILAHEGYPVNPNSHSGVFLREFQARAGPLVEDLVVPNDQLSWLAGAYQEKLNRLTLEVDSISDSEVDGSHKVPFGCTFYYGR